MEGSIPPLQVQGSSKFTGVILSPLLRNRLMCRLLLAACAIMGIWVAFGKGLWPCWFYKMTHRPCLTCGMTRGVRRSLTGDWNHVLESHAFTPLVFIIGTFVFVSAVMPTNAHHRWVDQIEKIERRSKISVFLFAAFLLYGVLRIFSVFPDPV